MPDPRAEPTHQESPGARPSAIRWAIPAVGVVGGVAYLVAGILGHALGFGLFGLALMLAAVAAMLLLRRRSETIQGLLDQRDERINAININATAAAGSVVVLAVLVGLVVSIATGHDGVPYAWLAAVGGVAYVLALVVLRLRG